MRQSPTRIRHSRCSLFTLRHPGGRGSFPSARIAVTIRFLTDRSSRLSSRSARDVIVTLYINLSGLAHLFDNLIKRTARLVAAFFVAANQVQVFHQLLV